MSNAATGPGLTPTREPRARRRPRSRRWAIAFDGARGDMSNAVTGRGLTPARGTSPAPRGAELRRVAWRLALRGLGRRRLGERRARERERPWLRLRPRLPLGLGLADRAGRDLLREDIVLGRAGEQPVELILVDRLALDEDRGELVELVEVLVEHGDCAVVRLLDDAPNLVVDLARDLLGVVGLGAHLASEERHVVVPAEHARPELLAHAVPHLHLLRDPGHLLEIVGGAGRDLLEDELLGSAPAQRHRKPIHEVRLRRQVAILARQRDGVAERLPAADDRDLVHLG